MLFFSLKPSYSTCYTMSQGSCVNTQIFRSLEVEELPTMSKAKSSYVTSTASLK